MQDPQPAGRWVGSNRPKSADGWKPFTGPLSPRSIRHAETILGHLYSFLLEQGYNRFNPYRSLSRLRNTQGSARFDGHRSLSHSQWAFLNAYMEDQLSRAEEKQFPETDPITLKSTRSQQTTKDTNGHQYRSWLRLRLMMKLLYATGLRLHELAQAKQGDIIHIERDGQLQCWLQVLGKGKKQREVPIPPKLYGILKETSITLTRQAWATNSHSFPLIPALRGDTSKTLTPKAIYLALKACFQEAAIELKKTDPESALTLIKATTHWLRHTHGTHAVDRNIPLTVIRDNLGHSSLAVTSQYVHADKDKRHEDMLQME